jgi:hypothetical protein
LVPVVKQAYYPFVKMLQSIFNPSAKCIIVLVVLPCHLENGWILLFESFL